MKKFLSAIIASLVMLFSFSSCDWDEITDDTYYTYTCKIATNIDDYSINLDYFYHEAVATSGSSSVFYLLKDRRNETMFNSKLMALEDVLEYDRSTDPYDINETKEEFEEIQKLLRDNCSIFSTESDEFKKLCKEESSFNEMIILVKKPAFYTYDLIYFKMNKKSR